MLSETIKSALPATEEQILQEILQALGNVSHDYVLAELQRMVRRSDVRRGFDGKYRVFTPPADEPDPPQYVKKKRKCVRCGVTYEGITLHFGSGTAKSCNACRERFKKIRSRPITSANGTFNHRKAKHYK